MLCCFQWFKDTNLKANHNSMVLVQNVLIVVSNGSKILIWKQITTFSCSSFFLFSCFQWFKDTNLKANHNYKYLGWTKSRVVSNGSKILIWKQITTRTLLSLIGFCCFQWFKDTNLKANHNAETVASILNSVVSNGSKILIWKQITTLFRIILFSLSCFQWFKDTNLKANHN